MSVVVGVQVLVLVMMMVIVVGGYRYWNRNVMVVMSYLRIEASIKIDVNGYRMNLKSRQAAILSKRFHRSTFYVYFLGMYLQTQDPICFDTLGSISNQFL